LKSKIFSITISFLLYYSYNLLESSAKFHNYFIGLREDNTFIGQIESSALPIHIPDQYGGINNTQEKQITLDTIAGQYN